MASWKPKSAPDASPHIRLLAWTRTPGGAAVAWEWMPDDPKPRTQTFEGIWLRGTVALGPKGEAWLAAGAQRSARVLHGRNGKWSVSREWRVGETPPYPAVHVETLALGADGAVWVVLGGRHTDLVGLWRRPAGPEDRWEQLAASSFDDDGPWPAGILPLDDGGAVANLTSHVDGRARASLVRIRVGSPSAVGIAPARSAHTSYAASR